MGSTVPATSRLQSKEAGQGGHGPGGGFTWSPISRVSSNPGIGSHTAIGFYPQHHTETNTMQELCGFSPPAAGLPFSWKTNSSAFPRHHSTSLSLCHTSFWLPGEGEGERVRGYGSEVAGSLRTFVCSQVTIPTTQNDDAPTP